MQIINTVSNPFVWMGILAVGALVVRRKLNSYLKLISLLIDAIEIVDKEIKDILPNEEMAKLTKIKGWIAQRVGKDAPVLNKQLMNKGYLKAGNTGPQ